MIGSVERAISRETKVMTDTSASNSAPLGLAPRGFCGRIRSIRVGDGAHGLTAEELERRLLELGFVEGAAVEILHEGPVGGDPIAVRLNQTTIALRRREAMAVLVD
jgi:ferrous iron transport protein A